MVDFTYLFCGLLENRGWLIVDGLKPFLNGLNGICPGHEGLLFTA